VIVINTLHAPHVIDLEVAQVLRRYTHSGEMDAQRSEQAFEDLADLAINRYPHDLFLFRIWALRRNLISIRCGLRRSCRSARRPAYYTG
jgi:predicted nucleic acid-binding protein